MGVFDEAYEKMVEITSLEDQLLDTINLNSCDQAFQLITAGAELNALDWFGWTPLHNCTSYEMVKLLIQIGAEPEHENEKGQSVWMNRSPELLKFIERAQVDHAAKELTAATTRALNVSSRRF